MMAAYLIDHPPKSPQYRTPRREKPSGVITVHTAENTPDFVAYDGGAESVALWISRRTDPGSYHDLVDSDSAILLVPYTAEAFHDATGGNRHSLGLSIATRADVWPLAPQRWRDGAIEQAARAAHRQAVWIRRQTGITVPARRITRAESEARVPGFISHAQRDPTRRTDPGAEFPWAGFLARYAALTDPTPQPPPQPEEDDMRHLVKATDGPLKGRWYITDGILKRYVDDKVEALVLVNAKLCTAAGKDSGGYPIPHDWPADVVEDLKDVREL